MHFGIVTPPVPGHIHPFGALGRELTERGHRVTVFHMPDLEERVRNEGLEFVPVGHYDHPLGSLPLSLAELGRRKGFAALRFTIRAVARTTEMMLRDAPDAMRAAGVDCLLVDQMEPAGGSIAERLGLPFVTICNALALNREPSIPPPFTPWSYRPEWWARARNSCGYKISDNVTRPVSSILARWRRQWHLPPHQTPEDSFSPLAQISQQPRLFDFPRRELPPEFHYAGPLRKLFRNVSFPWERLDGRPLVYASLGTLQNNRLPLFQCFAEACVGLEVQLVISHGGGLRAAEISSLPGSPLVVSYAPQLELLARAQLTITHAGLNTVLDSLTHGVPLIAIPITFEQPAIAERVRYSGAGEVFTLGNLNPNRLRSSIRRVLATESYRKNAGYLADAIRISGGVKGAADILIKATAG